MSLYLEKPENLLRRKDSKMKLRKWLAFLMRFEDVNSQELKTKRN